MRSFHLYDLVPIVLGLLIFLAVLTSRDWWPLARPIVAALVRGLITSSQLQPADMPAGMDRSDIPVCSAGMASHTSTAEPAGMSADQADIDAENDQWQAPRVSAFGTVEDDIIFLAMRRAGPGQKHRYSANKIAQVVGGDRNTVLALVKKVRSTEQAPIYYDDMRRQIEAEQSATPDDLADHGRAQA